MGTTCPTYKIVPWQGGAVSFPLRAVDKFEVEGLGHDPTNVLEECLLMSTEAYVVTDSHGAPVAVFGINVIPGIMGVPWLLASNRFVPECVSSTRLVKEARAYLREWSLRYGEGVPLRNIVWEGNFKAIGFLKLAGCTFTPDSLWTPYEFIEGFAPRNYYLEFTYTNV